MTTSIRPLWNRRLWAASLAILLLLVSGCSAKAKAESEAGGGSLYDQIKKAGVLRVGSRVDNPPHSFYDDKGGWVGFDLDIANAIAKRWGVKLEMVKVDELTRISYLQNNKIDLAEGHNPETRVAWEGARAQAAALGIARSELFPTLVAIALAGVDRSDRHPRVFAVADEGAR